MHASFTLGEPHGGEAMGTHRRPPTSRPQPIGDGHRRRTAARLSGRQNADNLYRLCYNRGVGSETDSPHGAPETEARQMAMTPEERAAHCRRIAALGGRAHVAARGKEYMARIGRVGFQAAIDLGYGKYLATVVLRRGYYEKYGTEPHIKRNKEGDKARARPPRHAGTGIVRLAGRLPAAGRGTASHRRVEGQRRDHRPVLRSPRRVGAGVPRGAQSLPPSLSGPRNAACRRH